MISLKAIIVDDEEHCRKNLAHLITEHFPEVELTGQAKDAEEARKLVQSLSPDLLFLDIDMPGENGFRFLESMPKKDFSVVFVTAHDHYSIRALKASAVDFLLKPLLLSELKSAVARVFDLRAKKAENRDLADHYLKSLQHLLSTYRQKEAPKKLTLPDIHGFRLIDVEDIIRIQADNNYAVLFLKDGKKHTLSRPLGEIEKILDPASFIRVHKSHLINLRFLKEYSTREGSALIMSDECKISVSRRRLPVFLEAIKAYSLTLQS